MSKSKNKKKTPAQIKARIEMKRMARTLYFMKRTNSGVPEGHSKRVFVFWPEETGIEVPFRGKTKMKEDSRKYKVTKTKLVKNYTEDSNLTEKQNTKARHEYDASIRAQTLREVKESLAMSIVLPGQHDPDGPTTLDLGSLTSAGD